MEKQKKQIKAPKFVGESVARDECEIGFQQLSELKYVKGVDIYVIPKEIQYQTTFSGAIVAGSKVKNKAEKLLNFLASPVNASIIRETGLEPAVNEIIIKQKRIKQE